MFVQGIAKSWCEIGAKVWLVGVKWVKRKRKEAEVFVDEVMITVESGKGGAGCCSFRREKYIPFGGPNGGDGGKGGDVILKAQPDLNTLFDLRYKKHYKAESGKPGQGSDRHGRHGQDLIIELPVGTIVSIDGEALPLADLNQPEMTVCVAKGGLGGAGNVRFKSSVNRAPRQFGPGEPGEVLRLKLELKLLADVGLVGLPNAGKSSLIAGLTRAKPKIANYPFTTLEPNLGVLFTPDHRSVVLADIPGLIEGASEGAGLGHRFLKHVSRCRMLLHVLDVTAGLDEEQLLTVSVDVLARDVFRAFIQVCDEMLSYSKSLLEKPQILVLNQSDKLSEAQRSLVINAFLEQLTGMDDVLFRAIDENQVFLVSAVSYQGLSALFDAVALQA